MGLGYGAEGVAPVEYRSRTRFTTPPITIPDAEQALEAVLDQTGATAPQHDTADARVVAQVRSGTGAIIDSPSDVGGYPNLAAGQPVADADHDGMPDAWELELSLDPSDPADGSGDLDGDGYTNLEEYLQWLSEAGACD